MLSKFKFRLLLSLSPILLLIAAILGAIVSFNAFGKLDASQTAALMKDMQPALTFLNRVNQVSAFVGIVAWIGMFLFWRPARILYAANYLLGFSVFFVDWWIPSPNSEALTAFTNAMQQTQIPFPLRLLGWAPYLLSACIIYVSFSRYGSHLFERNNAETRTLSPAEIALASVKLVALTFTALVLICFVMHTVFLPTVRQNVPGWEKTAEQIKDSLAPTDGGPPPPATKKATPE